MDDQHEHCRKGKCDFLPIIKFVFVLSDCSCLLALFGEKGREEVNYGLRFLHDHDGMRLNPNEKHSVVDEADRLEALRMIEELKAENDRLRKELAQLQESLGQKLAACDCAAMMDTAEAHEEAKIEKDNPFWSPAYESVMRRTAECIKLRKQLADKTAAHEAKCICAETSARNCPVHNEQTNPCDYCHMAGTTHCDRNHCIELRHYKADRKAGKK